MNTEEFEDKKNFMNKNVRYLSGRKNGRSCMHKLKTI